MTTKRSKREPSKGRYKIFFALILAFYAGFNTSQSFFVTTTAPQDIVTISGLSPSYISSNNNKNHNFQLAYDQSFGFFTDISNESWKRLQQRARTRINHALKFHQNPIKFYNWQPSQWYMNNMEPDFTCLHERRIRGPGDGPKWVCDPHRLEQVSALRQKAKGESCLIYSVGSGGKWEFEDGMYDFFGNNSRVCEIHVFDPGNFEKLRDINLAERNVHFHKWGLKSSYDDTYKPNVDYGEFFTLAETLQRLNHTERTIDIFKIDCESCEWYSWKDWIRADIRQLLVETHDLPPDPLKGLDYFYGLQRAGFYMFHKEPNIHPKAAGNGIEWAYIRLSPAFFGTDVPNYDESFVKDHKIYKQYSQTQTKE